jgi:hypothetical protein
MKSYEAGSPAYFATPPVNLIHAFQASLSQITKGTPSLEERFKMHRQVSRQIKDAATNLGLRQVPIDSAYAANGMTAVSYGTPCSNASLTAYFCHSYTSPKTLSRPIFCHVWFKRASWLLEAYTLASRVSIRQYNLPRVLTRSG